MRINYHEHAFQVSELLKGDELDKIENSIREFKDLLGKCRFHNCAHESEPDCAVRDAVARNEIAPERLCGCNSTFFR